MGPAAATAVLLLLAAAPPSKVARFVYYADLQTAMMQTAAGKRAETELRSLHERAQREIDRRKEGLEKRGSSMDKAARDAEIAALEAFKKEQEHVIQTREQQVIAAIQQDLERALADAGRASPERVLIDIRKLPILNPNPACDRSAWLAESADKKKPAPAVDVAACRYERILGVEVTRLLEESESGRARAGVTKDPKQPPEKALEDARLFFETVAIAMRRAAETIGGTLVIDTSEGVPPPPGTCDATSWAIALIDGKAKAEDGRASCAASR